MTDVLLDWARDSRSIYEAKELWRQATKSLATLDPARPVEERALIIDRFLAEAPAAVYAKLPALHAAHWPVLSEALRRSSDIEARLMLGAAAAERSDVAHFVAAIAGASNTPAVTVRVVKLGALPPAVLRACVTVFKDGYPPFSVSQSAAFVAVMCQGTERQRQELLALAPPPEAVAWLKPAAKKLPTAVAKAVNERIAGLPALTTGYARPEPFKRVHIAARAVTVQEPAPPTKTEHLSEETLLARVYARPDDVETLAVYADALSQRGAPLGELLQLQLARHAGKRGTTKHEKLLFETAGAAALWPEHPVVKVGAYLRFEDLELGFPAQLRIGRPPPASELATLKSLAGHPGWGTLRRIFVPHPLHLFLPDDMPVLQELWDVRGDELHHLAKKTWPVRVMALTSLTDTGEMQVSGLPQLSQLTVWGGHVDESLPHLARSGLLAKLKVLSLNSGLLNPQLLQTFSQLPMTLERLMLTFGVQNARADATAVRTKGKPMVLVETDVYSLDTVEAWLRALDTTAVSRVEVTLSSSGSFRKPERADAERRMRELLPRFPEHALHSKHPTR